MEQFNDNEVLAEEINIVLPNRFQHIINLLSFRVNMSGIEWGANNRNIVINSRNIDQARNMLRIIRHQPIYIHRPEREGQPVHLVCRGCISQMLSDERSVNRSLDITRGVSPFACPICDQPMDQDMLEVLNQQNELMNDLTSAINNYNERRNNMCNISGGKKTKKNKKTKKKLHNKKFNKKSRKQKIKKSRKQKIKKSRN